MYGIYDPPSGATPPVGFAGIPNRNNLQQQVLSVENVAGVSVRTVPNPSAIALPPTAGAVRGWYTDLSLNPGERIVTDPQIESVGGLVFTTYHPNPNVCSGGGSAYLMVLNFATGAAFPLPELDVTGDGKLDLSEVPSSGNMPVGMLLGAVYASTPALLPVGSGMGGTRKLPSVSSGTVDSVARPRPGETAHLMVGGTTMNARNGLFAVIVVAGALAGGSVGANTVPGDIITGNVTAVNGNQSLNIQGHIYRLKDGTPAIAAAAHLSPGQPVTVQLDGPASSPSSQVINVVPRTGR